MAATSSLERKQATIDQVSARLAEAQALILAEYRGLTVGAMTDNEIKDLFAYLQSLKPVHNRVPAPIDPPESGK